MSHIPEDYVSGPDPLEAASAYAEGKRMAELLCTLTPEVECVIARCFAFIGPHLPLDTHFAAGNFLRDALAGGPISLKGDGRSVRSYLHVADLMIWLLTLLVRASAGSAYNVGSDQAVTTLDLAQLIAAIAPRKPEVLVRRKPECGPAPRYVPDIRQPREILGLKPMLELDEAISRTLHWLCNEAGG
jgi:dTDP-glucose 4,6-dehydratase